MNQPDQGLVRALTPLRLVSDDLVEPAALDRLRVDARVGVAQRAATVPGVGRVLARLVARLSLDEVTAVRSAAIAALRTLPWPDQEGPLQAALVDAAPGRAGQLVAYLGETSEGDALIEAAVQPARGSALGLRRPGRVGTRSRRCPRGRWCCPTSSPFRTRSMNSAPAPNCELRSTG